jgi:DNA-binding FrmR family transcriptional regulator
VVKYPPALYAMEKWMPEAQLHESHPNIVKRLKPAEGHIRRVITMFDEGRNCLDLAQQLHAVEKAINEAKRQLIHDHVDHCLYITANGRGRTTRAVVGEFKAISRHL